MRLWGGIRSGEVITGIGISIIGIDLGLFWQFPGTNKGDKSTPIYLILDMEAPSSIHMIRLILRSPRIPEQIMAMFSV